MLGSNNLAIFTNHPVNSDAANGSTIGRDSAFVLFLVAFCFRLIYIIQSTDNPLFGVPIIDAKVYDEWAGRMVEGVWLWDSVGNYLPIYPAFLALQKMFFGTGPLVNKVVQSCMGSLSAVLIAQSAARTWNRKVGLIAGYLVAANWMLVVFEAEKFAESFSIFFMSLTIWLLVNASVNLWGITAAGFAFALCAGARANLFLLLPFILWWLIWLNRPRLKRGVFSAVLFCIGTTVVISPIIYRNYQISGVPMLRAQATWSLYAGLAPEFKGLHPPVGILFDKYMHLPLQAGLRTEKDVERFWGQKVLDVIREDSAGVAFNLVQRLMIFFNAREWSQEFDVYAYRAYSTFLSLPWVGFWLIGPLGCLGMILLRRPSKGQVLIAGCTIISFISIILFKASDRYRLPTTVLLSIFAAAAAWQIWRYWWLGDRRSVIRAFTMLAVFGMMCWPDWPDLENRKVARHDFHLALHARSVGHIDDALQHFKASMQKIPWDPDSPYHIGRIMINRGLKEDGLEFLREALRREPHFPDAINEVARYHLAQGDLKTAESRAQASLRLNPAEKDTLLLLAEISRGQGRRAEELSFLEKAVLESKDAEAAMVVADRLIELEKYPQAVSLFQLVMNAHDVERHLRVRAAMAAGITAVRFNNDIAVGQQFFGAALTDFGEFRFFALQAEFLRGGISEEELKRRMARGAEWESAAAYVIGLSRWVRGDLEGAAEAYKECLETVKADRAIRPDGLPQKWAWDDLQRIHAQLK